MKWHRDFMTVRCVKSKHSRSGRSRKRRAAFAPLLLEAEFVHRVQAPDEAKVAGRTAGPQYATETTIAQGARAGRVGSKCNLHRSRVQNVGLAVADVRWPRTSTKPCLESVRGLCRL